MERIPPEPGRIVFSKSGRDAGKYFIILSVLDDDYVLLCDGQMRKLANPKKKKLKHLAIKPECIDSLREKLLNDKRIFDSEVRSALESAGFYNRKVSGEE
ncbi:KOW domain-containing RNA-binding protein [Christensenellaceae bacterium NSJ-44]|uniref:KOW domain-containing RNA-binding protein n=1 Tax=Luoshenia tenuis TaxID=2763654 RepID=A0A926D1K8_9FIRM|nr:KOW domain-containing RNA-binding protein [Luoshenia tenuis]MBC8529867.1 KOW domain-containing RNA-binding protein [Luoshenia tenuis]